MAVAKLPGNAVGDVRNVGYKGDNEEFVKSLSKEVENMSTLAKRSDETYDGIYAIYRDAWSGNIKRQIVSRGYDKTLSEVRQRIYQNRPAITITK
jgi:hypothetical protein